MTIDYHYWNCISYNFSSEQWHGISTSMYMWLYIALIWISTAWTRALEREGTRPYLLFGLSVLFHKSNGQYQICEQSVQESLQCLVLDNSIRSMLEDHNHSLFIHRVIQFSGMCPRAITCILYRIVVQRQVSVLEPTLWILQRLPPGKLLLLWQQRLSRDGILCW